ncbi:MAG: CinA family protein [Deltaproteobacteria bacterium]|nr:CinA family protein [Deltaproteobacteria bacterium]
MSPAAEDLARRLTVAGLTVAAAESLTGGRVAAALTRQPGSSTYFLGSVVAYANEVKTNLLDVPTGLLSEHGAVSEACARAMAEGARRRLGADLAVAATGIAGPDGGSPAKPVGLVWLAVAGDKGVRTAEYRFAGDRRAVTEAATIEALKFLARVVDLKAGII